MTLKEVRLLHGFAQHELAHELDVKPNTISSWERGITTPRGKSRRKLVEVLGLSRAEVFALFPLRSRRSPRHTPARS